MIQLAYVSSSKGLLTLEELVSILAVSREKNARLGITGMLLYKDGNILQVIEGEQEDVLKLFGVIKNDRRHGGVIMLYQKNILERDFPNWTMGFHDLKTSSACQFEGANEFWDPSFDMQSIKSPAAVKLLSCFKAGLKGVK